MALAASSSSSYSSLSSLLLPSTSFPHGRAGFSSSGKSVCMQHHNSLSVGVRCLCLEPGISRGRGTTQNINLLKRREVIDGFLSGSVMWTFGCANASGAGLPPEDKPKLCDDACEKELENVPMVTTASGLQYKDIKIGGGPSPPVGFQVAANYVAMVPSGQIFDSINLVMGLPYYGKNFLSRDIILQQILTDKYSSLEKGQPYIFRVGSGQVVKGLDEGILSMKVGGKRRLYIPGLLAFPKGLTSAPGRPRVAPNSPVIFDVSLEYIPGLEADEE